MSPPSHPDPALGPPAAGKEASESARETSNPEAFAEPTPSCSQSLRSDPDETRPRRASLLGTRIGDFELVSELGRGGYGIVYKAKQLSLDRFVAVKLLLSEHCQNQKVLKRFLTEARTAAALEHPNIVKVYQVGECAHGHFFAMEYIDGPSLQTVMVSKRVRPSSAVAIMILVAEAVHHAHAKGIVHRDLKPANIMLDPKKRPVVMDFGIAKYIGKSSALTQHGAIIGTPGYLPPEQAGENAAAVGPHSDVYALGAILYSLLAGRPPFDEPTALKTIIKVISGEPPPPIRDFRGDVDPDLEAVCLRCLQLKPEDRYASAEALGKELRRFRAGKRPKTASARKKKAPLSIEELMEAPTREIRSQPAKGAATLVDKSTGQRIPLHFGDTIIGRASDCDIIVRASDVSKRHCQIKYFADTGIFVEDLKSINGTTVNGNAVEEARLFQGDELGVAGHVFRVVFAK